MFYFGLFLQARYTLKLISDLPMIDNNETLENQLRKKGYDNIAKLSNELSTYPVKFARPIYFGESPLYSDIASIKSATASLLRFDNLFIAVTCNHVLDGYLEKKELNNDTVFCIGDLRVEPSEILIDKNSIHDLVTFNLTSYVGKSNSLKESDFIEPVTWPPNSIDTNDVIAFAGFPGFWREQPAVAHLRFYSYSSGASEIYSIGEDYFYTRTDLDKCVIEINNGKVLGSLGGLSGGPVFTWRKLYAEVTGFIIEYQSNLDLLFIRSSNVLNRNGTFIN